MRAAASTGAAPAPEEGAPPRPEPASAGSVDRQSRAVEAESRSPGASDPAGDAESLVARVKRLDTDRWLASRFAPRAERDRLVALYAVAADVARAADGVKEPLLAQMRLTWWRDALETMLDGGQGPAPPALRALAAVQAEVGFDRGLMLGLADARLQEQAAEPFENWADLDAYIDATAGATIQLAFQALAIKPDGAAGAPSSHQISFARALGRAWGYAGLLRSMGFWRAQGRSFFPTRMASHFDLDHAEFQHSAQGYRPQAAIRALMDRAVGAYREAQRLQVGLPAGLFPAYGYVALTPAYLAAIEAAQSDAAIELPLLRRQATLLWRALRGGL
jgi:phytoene synthase